MTEQAVPPATEDAPTGGAADPDPEGRQRRDDEPATGSTTPQGGDPAAPQSDDPAAPPAEGPDEPAGPQGEGPGEPAARQGAGGGDPAVLAGPEPRGDEPADGETEADDDVEPTGGWHPLLRVAVTLGVVAVLVGALVFLGLRYDVAGRLLNPDATAEARVGDCLAKLPEVAEGGQRRAEARVVSCSSPDAAYDVVGRLDGLTGEQARDGRRCEPFVAAGGTYYTYQSVPSGGTGYLLCLVPRS